jgi:hypothetical protein
MKALHKLLLLVLLDRAAFSTVFGALSKRIIAFVVCTSIHKSLGLHYLLEVLAQSLLNLCQRYVKGRGHITVVCLSTIERRFSTVLTI